MSQYTSQNILHSNQFYRFPNTHQSICHNTHLYMDRCNFRYMKKNIRLCNYYHRIHLYML